MINILNFQVKQKTTILKNNLYFFIFVYCAHIYILSQIFLDKLKIDYSKFRAYILYILHLLIQTFLYMKKFKQNKKK